MGAFDRILKRLHRVFNKNADSVAVLSIQRDGNWTLRIADLTLTAEPEGGDPVTVDLSTGTLQGLANTLTAAGFVAEVLLPEFAPMLARGVMETAAIGPQENDTAADLAGEAFTALDGSPLLLLQPLQTQQTIRLNYPRSALWAEFRTFGWELDDQSRRQRTATDQVYFDRSRGEWLNDWGTRFGIERFKGETDEAYVQRIAGEIVRPTQNNVALEIILEEAIGVAATILDAWPNRDELDPADQAKTPGHFLLDLSIPNVLSPEDTQALIDKSYSIVRRHKAAGTDFFQTVLRKIAALEESLAVTETHALTVTAALEESYQPGLIYSGAGWRSGTPGLVSGTNDAIKEQVYVQKILVADGSVESTYSSGG